MIIPGLVMFRLLVVGVPAASPGRTLTQPIEVGPTTVTFATIPVAPSGTGDEVDVVVSEVAIGIVPVTSSLRATPATSGPSRPTGMRVSSTRTGAIVTSADGASAAFTATRPAAPSVTATAAPNAAQRDLQSRCPVHANVRARFGCVQGTLPSSCGPVRAPAPRTRLYAPSPMGGMDFWNVWRHTARGVLKIVRVARKVSTHLFGLTQPKRG